MEDSEKYLMVAALDFGTTYSGYAFSMRSDFLKQPLDIQANPVWKAGSQKFMSLKTPTCLLLDSKQEFVAFGFDAEDQWTDLLYEEEHEEYYFFERFKMNLHNNKVLYYCQFFIRWFNKSRSTLGIFFQIKTIKKLSYTEDNNFLSFVIEIQPVSVDIGSCRTNILYPERHHFDSRILE